MTDQELDQIMRRILIDAQNANDAKNSGESIVFTPSASYERSVRAMCKDPLKWVRNRERPVWKRVMRQAAMILLVISLGFGSVMAVSPPARAAVLRWVVEWYETHIVYRYSGDDVSQDAHEYTISELPDGFYEISRVDMENMVVITYTDDAGNALCFNYVLMQQGAATSIETSGTAMREVSVEGKPGFFFEAMEADEFNTLIWIDEQIGVKFTISGLFDFDTLLSMAENVS